MIACPCEVCSSADPKDKRLRSSILVRSETTTLVVDTTPDFRTQMLREGVRNLDAVLFTHPHKDHIAGLDDVKAFNYFQRQTMHVHADVFTKEALKREFHYVFAEHKYPGVPDIQLHTIGEEKFSVGNIEVLPFKAMHLKMPVTGFRFGDFVYLTDANFIADEQKEKLRGAKVMVVNALRREKHISHYTVDEAAALVQELNIPQAYFTHISHQLGKHADVNPTLPAGVELAFDGLRISVN